MSTPEITEAVLTRRVVARNDAEESENRIHDDRVAAEYGFRGGLVPGVTVYAYLSTLPAVHWGRDWLERGTMSARFHQPVYDGEEIELRLRAGRDGTSQLEAVGADGEVRARGTATQPAPGAAPPPPALPAVVSLPAPEARPPAEAAVLETVALGTCDRTWTAAAQATLLTAIGEPAASWPLPQFAHPGWLIRGANDVLSRSVRLGPWIHVSSDTTHHGTVTEGQLVSTRGWVTKVFERKGHEFVELDVVVDADGAPVWSIRHVAIYRPRPVSSGSDDGHA
jgi:acyl dehydratase